MNNTENEEIRNIPEKYKPLTAWQYFGLSILYAIPVIGFICLLVHAFSSKSIVRRSYARSFFCGLILVAIIIVIAIVALGGLEGITSIFNDINL